MFMDRMRILTFEEEILFSNGECVDEEAEDNAEASDGIEVAVPPVAVILGKTPRREVVDAAVDFAERVVCDLWRRSGAQCFDTLFL